MRVAVDSLFRAWNIYHLEHLDGFLARFLLIHVAMDAQALHDLLADGHGRVQRGHWILEDHADLVAAECAQLFFVQRQHVLAVAGDFGAFLNYRERRFQQTQQRFCGNAFAAAGFTYKCQSLTGSQVKADTAHRLDLAGIGIKGYA